MNEAATMEFKSEGFNTQFNGERMKASIEAAQAKEGDDASFEPGDVGATVQTDADINP